MRKKIPIKRGNLIWINPENNKVAFVESPTGRLYVQNESDKPIRGGIDTFNHTKPKNGHNHAE